MNLAQRFARTFDRSTTDSNESAQAIAPVAYALWTALEEGHVAIEREAMHQQMGPDWSESAALASSGVQVEPIAGDQVRLDANEQSKSLDARPIVFGYGHWYLQRFAAIEQRIAAAIARLNRPDSAAASPLTASPLAVPPLIVPPLTGSSSTDRLAPGLNPEQHQAMQQALTHRLLVLTGGPGTGKTFTLVSIVNALREIEPTIRIAACAPTGKAALRLGSQVSGLSTVSTIHRLLRQPRDNAGHLNYDQVIVDEASMLDAVLADQLFQALGPNTRLILAGDRNQLSSVRAGAVFAQLCSIESVTVELTEAVRFKEGSLIGRLALAVLKNDLLTDDLMDQIDWLNSWPNQTSQTSDQAPPTPASMLRAKADDDRAWFDALRKGYQPLLDALRIHSTVDEENAVLLLQLLKNFGVLVPTHEGPTGTQASHQLLQQWIRRDLSPWYHGRVIAITQNDDATGLRNGDIGLLVNTKNGIRAVFDAVNDDNASKSGAPASLCWLSPLALPAHDDGWVLTVHKSQGSEYKNVLLALPQLGSPQSRCELIYTAITRAKESIQLFGDADQLRAAAQTKTERGSGLIQRLMHQSNASTSAR